MGWIDLESFWLFCPAIHDVFERGETFEGLETLGEVIGIDEGCEMFTQPIMAVGRFPPMPQDWD